MNKHGWTYKKFEDCLVKAAKAKQVQTSEYNSGSKYPIISQEDKMVSGYCDNDSLLYHIDNPVVIFGDHTRVLKYVDFDFVVGADGVKILIPKEFLKAKFLLYYLRWYQVPSLGYSRHYKLLKEIVLPVPPIAEQERIVAELDLLSGIIDKKKEQLKAYDQLAQSIFYTMFGDPVENERKWDISELNNVCDVRDGTHDTPEYHEEGYPLITSKNVVDGRIIFDNVNFISKEDFDNISKRSRVDDGDIIMPMIGTIGKPTIVVKDRDFAIKNVALIKFVPNTRVLNIFIQSIMASSSFDTYMKSRNKGGTQKFIALGDIRKLKVPVPPLSLQQEFAEKVEAIERQKALVQQSIDEAQTMFDYTMDKYFG